MNLFIITTLSLLVTIPCRGLALSLNWGWFLVPLGVPSIGIMHAAGISLVVSWLTHQHNEHEISEDIIGRTASSLISSLLAILFGYLYFSISETF